VVVAIPGETMYLPVAMMQETAAIGLCCTFEGHTEALAGVIHLPGEHRMMTCSYDGSLRVWDLQNGKQIGDDWRDGESEFSTIALSPDGKTVTSGSDDGAVRLWDVETGKVLAKWTGHESRTSSLCWHRDSGRLASGSRDGTTRVWDVESRKTVLVIDTGLGSVRAVIYSPDTTMIATGGGEGEGEEEAPGEYIKIWDAKTGKLFANLKGHADGVNCLAWTAKTLISGSDDGSIRTWNTTTWQQIAVLRGHTNYVWSIAISPNGRILASASGDKTARLWNLENNQLISLLKHVNRVGPTSFSTDGRLLATGCMDRNAYRWDIVAIVKEAGLSERELLLNQNVS
jgi:WD40 repeat protein